MVDDVPGMYVIYCQLSAPAFSDVKSASEWQAVWGFSQDSKFTEV